MDVLILKERLEALGVENIRVMTDKSLRAPCPLHDGSNPTSFSADIDNGAFCFSCHNGFHSANDLIRYLSEKVGVPFEPIHRDVKSIFAFLETSDEGEYPLNQDIIDFYEHDYDFFKETWEVSEEVFDRHHLVRDEEYHQFFPITDRKDRFWGFVERYQGLGRSIYMYPSGLNKKRLLLGEDVITEELSEIWVTEGVRDLCSIETKLPEVQAVALGGAHLTDEQAAYLKRFDKVVCATDNDRAGLDCRWQFYDKIPKSQLYFALYSGKDPFVAEHFEVEHCIL